uniref:Uncharacterized protein n=1 Tax=Romanomermis culicivorax TaxID=13658 RepID=A0A915KFP1_ROMCU
MTSEVMWFHEPVFSRDKTINSREIDLSPHQGFHWYYRGNVAHNIKNSGPKLDSRSYINYLGSVLTDAVQCGKEWPILVIPPLYGSFLLFRQLTNERQYVTIVLKELAVVVKINMGQEIL